MRFEINKQKPIPELNLSLHKPSEEQIGNLPEAYNRSGNFSFGGHNELTISIPKYVARKHKKVHNKNYENLRERYLVKATYGNFMSEWMIVTKIHKNTDNIPNKVVTLKSRQYEMNDKIIKDYKVESYTPRQIMEDVLMYTNWKIGVIDVKFDTIYRSFDETSITVINLLYKMAETFDGALVFDTHNRIIDLRERKNVEIDLGLHASYGKYLKTVDQESDSESMVTRLYVYGKDKMSINEENPTGVSFLEDFSYFMMGYKEDADGNVIGSSHYMSDSLCEAIIRYNKLLNLKDGEFKTLLDERKPIQDSWIEKLNEYYSLEIDFIILEDKIDISKAAGIDYTDLIIQRNAKKLEIDTKQEEIDDIEIDLMLIENDIKDLQDEISVENNFTPKQIVERNDYIIEGEWEDTNYFEVDELLKAGREKLNKSNEPKKELNLSLVQFMEVVESQNDWDKIGLGFSIRVDYDPIDVEFKAIISEIKIGFDSKDIDISISNIKYKSNKKEFAEMLYNTAISTSQKVDMGKLVWDESANKTTEMEDILQGTWDAAKRRITAGVNESVDISGRGIQIINPEFSNERVIMQSGVIALSKNAGEDWQTAISADGIVAERLYGRMIAGQNLVIENDSGLFRFDENGAELINADFSIVTEDDKSRILLNPNDGIKIQKNKADEWVDQFYVDSEGNAKFMGDMIAGSVTGSAITSFDNDSNNVVTLENGNITTFSNGKQRFGMYGNGLVAYHWETESEVATFRASHRDNRAFGAGIVASGDYFTIGRQEAGTSGTSLPQLDFTWDGDHDDAYLYGGSGERDSGYLRLQSTRKGGSAGGRVPHLVIDNRTSSGTAYSGARFYLGRDNRSPSSSNFRSGFEVWQYKGDENGGLDQLFEIDTNDEGIKYVSARVDEFNAFADEFYVEGRSWLGGGFSSSENSEIYGDLDMNGWTIKNAQRLNVSRFGTLDSSTRVIEMYNNTITTNDVDYTGVSLRRLDGYGGIHFHKNHGMLTGGVEGKFGVLRVGSDSTSALVQSIDIYNRTYTSTSQMVRVTHNGILGMSTSSRRYKINEKVINLDYAKRIHDINAVSWYDKRSAEDYCHTLTTGEETEEQKVVRIGGVIAEDIHDAGLKMYVNYDGKNRPHGVSGFTWTLLIPISKDHEDRLNLYGNQLNEHNCQIACLVKNDKEQDVLIQQLQGKVADLTKEVNQLRGRTS